MDDGLVAASSRDDIEKLMSYLASSFETKSGILEYYLGLEIDQRSDGSIHVSQKGYIKRILQKFNLSGSNPVSTPMDMNRSMSSASYPEFSEDATNIPYREAVGSLIYLAQATRPDITYAVSVTSKYLEKPKIFHWNAVKRIFKYLHGTEDYGIIFESNNDNKFFGFSDADYAGDVDTRRSTSGYIFQLGSNPISWCSKQQSTVALSTTEAEYMAACHGLKELIWLSRLVKELFPHLTEIPKLYVDNQSAIRLIKNPELHKRSKHIDIKYHFIREKYLEQFFECEYIPTDSQLADIFTKPLNKQKFQLLRNLMNIVSFK